MVSNISAFSRQPMPKFGEANRPYQEPSLVKGAVQAAESPAAQKAKELAKPSVHAAFEIAPAIIRAVNGAIAASVGLYLSKRLAERFFPTAAAKSFEHELAEMKLKKRAEAAGTELGKLSSIGAMILTGSAIEAGKEVSKATVGIAKGFIPKHNNELEALQYQIDLHTARDKHKALTP